MLFAWDMIEPGLKRFHDNVIIREFAHALGFLDGVIDGAPPLFGQAEAANWVEVSTHEYERLRFESMAGKPTLLDPYGSRNPAEFFAVVTDYFLTRPRPLRELHPELYEQLAAFYLQDPADWAW